ncbi:hypothetical protein GCM10023196_079360 [Actinoallomurus vinaceus]|uniref:DUF6286 domain-containing protein n=1 Tax=Actinoallomurus vinaceus TaxID=1080074 RepID=A0ABP8UMA1_9ACTN
MERAIADADGAQDTIVQTLEIPALDRSGARGAAVRLLRPRRTPAGILTAALLTVAGAATATRVISTLLGHPVPRTAAVARAARLLRTTAWSDPVVLAMAGGVALAGLLLLLAALLPSRGSVAALVWSTRRCALGVGRSGLCAALEAAALDVPGIAEARVRLRGPLRRRAVVYAATGYRNPGTLRELAAEAVRARIDDIGLLRAPRVVVRLDWRRD